MNLEITIHTVENGFTITTRTFEADRRAQYRSYIAESERTLLDTISEIWRAFKDEKTSLKRPK